MSLNVVTRQLGEKKGKRNMDTLHGRRTPPSTIRALFGGTLASFMFLFLLNHVSFYLASGSPLSGLGSGEPVFGLIILHQNIGIEEGLPKNPNKRDTITPA